MTNNTQLPTVESSPLELPKEWKDKIEGDAQFKASLQFHSKYSPDEHNACMIMYRHGAMAYAPWLYTCQTNYAALKAKCERYEVALKVAQIALETCYDVINFPADGETRQDKAIETINEAISEKEGGTPDWIKWLSDRGPDVPDLSNCTQEEKQMLVDSLFQACGGQFMKMFYAVGLEKFMESGLVNDSTGDLFRLRFELLQKGGDSSPKRKSFKERLAEEQTKQCELPGNPVELEPGTKFRNIHMTGFTFYIRDFVQAENILSVLIVDDLDNSIQRIERDWNLQHTLWAFEKGEYYLPQ